MNFIQQVTLIGYTD